MGRLPSAAELNRALAEQDKARNAARKRTACMSERNALVREAARAAFQREWDLNIEIGLTFTEALDKALTVYDMVLTRLVDEEPDTKHERI